MSFHPGIFIPMRTGQPIGCPVPRISCRGQRLLFSPQPCISGIHTPPTSSPQCGGGCGTGRRNPDRSPPPRRWESQSPGGRYGVGLFCHELHEFHELKNSCLLVKFMANPAPLPLCALRVLCGFGSPQRALTIPDSALQYR